MRRLSDRDLALDRAMIPLGSCTMKLNSAAEMMPVSWREFSLLHPFAPREQAKGYEELITDLSLKNFAPSPDMTLFPCNQTLELKENMQVF